MLRNNSSNLTATFAGFRRLPGGNFPFTMIPNQFLDEIVPNEKPCVVKVVCLILRRTLGWLDEKGQRRQQEQVAYSEFAREMNMSIQAVADGVRIALEKGYIVRLKQGSSQTGEGAWYSLRWVELAAKNASENQTESEKQSESESEKQNPTTLKNRDMLKKPDSESKKVEIKANSKLEITTPVTGEKGETENEANKKFSAYIGNLLTEIGQQFGDTENHRLPNIKHALNLWDTKSLSETAFAKLIYQARDLTRTHASAYSGSSTPQNRMPYFFRVLENLVAPGQTEPSSTAQPVPATALLNPPPDPAIAQKASLTPAQPACSSVSLDLALDYATQPETVTARWQQVLACAAGTPLAAITKRSLGLEANLATPALLNCLELAANKSKTLVDIIIIFRNSFEAHLAGNHFTELQNLLETVWATKIVLHLTHL